MSEKITEKLPKEFTSEMKDILGKDYEKYISSLSESPVRGLRVNTNKISVNDFLNTFDLPLKKLGYGKDCFILESDDKIGNNAEHLAGLIYLQEPSSMLPVLSSGIDKENRPLKVLDLCAAPGGKTGQIATIISKDSIIFSNEIIRSRAEILYSNVERQGFKNVVILNEEPKNLADFEGYFDYVFVDAPCSGEGMFRKNPETIGEWNTGNVELCYQRQREILAVAEKLVAEDGKLIYSTCTFSKEEDEKIVEWFIENFGYEIQDVPDEIKKVTVPSTAKVDGGEFARKFYPFTGDGEGQFLCVFKKNIDEKPTEKLYKKKHFKNLNVIGRSDCNFVTEFMKNNMKKVYTYNDIYELGKTVFLAPVAFDEKLQTAIDFLKLISFGVKLGTIEKGRFEPNHNLFIALCDELKRKIELSDNGLKKYLHGEELDLSAKDNFSGETLTENLSDGYSVICYKGYAVGGGKILKGKVKNLYPKGLRV